MPPRLLRHPTVHVLLLGLLLAVAIVITKGPPTTEDDARRILITASDVEQLRGAWMRRWQREPTRLELRGELEEFIREEVLYRDALARGLDKNDLVVRRAMRRKMEFLGDAQARLEEPTDEEIRAYYALRRERYREPAIISFAQVYFSVEARGDRAEADALAARAVLEARDPEPGELSGFGDPLMLRDYYSDATERELQADFGDEFASAVLSLEPGTWQGPIRSGFGLHLVRVYRRQESAVPEWTEIKRQVMGDMQYEARKAAEEQFFQEVARQYQILLDNEAQRILEGQDDS